MVAKTNILKFTRPSSKLVYNCHNPREVCIITRLGLGLSHLGEYKFKHGFQDKINPLYSGGNDKWSRVHITFSPLLTPIF